MLDWTGTTVLYRILDSMCLHVCVSACLCTWQVERETAQSMQKLVYLDTIKTRMKESQNALQVCTYCQLSSEPLF